jgi:UDP-GlcNAc:undecaprenyl-phosphate GlcNAc-1-phosphate transferase
MDIKVLMVSFFLCALLQFLIQKFFIKGNLFDDINHRSSHYTYATRTGGIGVFLTLLIISLFYYFNDLKIFDYSLFIPLSIMFIVGVYDDFYNADFKLKFFFQIIVAKILIDQGYVIENFHGLLGLNHVSWLFAQVSTIFVFLVIVNAFNFIDGIDGLAISITLKCLLIILFISNYISSITILNQLIISSLLPLYYFNYKKINKVFLGDSGSLLLGTVVSISLFTILNDEFIIVNDLRLNKAFLAVLLVIYPLLDLARVFFIRISNGKSPFTADNNHIHHLLIKRVSAPIAVLIITTMSLLPSLFYIIYSL